MMRDVRVTARTATPRIRIGSTDAPDTATHNGRPVNTHRITRTDRSARHIVVTDRDTGFVTDVRTGRDTAPGYVATGGTTAPNADDMRHPTRTDARGRHIATHRMAPTGPSRRWDVNTATGRRVIVDDNANGGIITPRMIRTVADGDDRLPGVRMPVRTPRSTTPRNTSTDRPARTDRLADVRAFAAAHGIPAEKLADRRVVAAIRDVMAHRAGVAAYAAR